MSSLSLPFYQKHHRHYDRDYRNTQLSSTMQEYRQEEKRSTATHSHRVRSKFSDEMLETSSGSPQMKRAKQDYYSKGKENEAVDYIVPVFRGCHEHFSGITSSKDERTKQSKSSHFAGESHSALSNTIEEHHIEKSAMHKSRKVAIRESAERISLNKEIYDTQDFHKRLREDSLLRLPEFIIKPRSHTVWEKQNVKLHCTVSGWPVPRVTWYKNNVSINVHTDPGKYIIDSKYGVHSLEINNCDFDDTAQYRASAMNAKGELSTFASVVVKRFKAEHGDLSFHPGRIAPPSYDYFPGDPHMKFEVHFVDKFNVSFGKEGDTLSLGCTVIVHPNLKRFQPEIQWWRNGIQLQPSKWVEMHWSGETATLTFTHLNKEDEGLYTIRVLTKSGYEVHSAYVFVRDADAEVAGAPGAPLDVYCLDANKDYVIVTWKQPAVDGGSSILGYFVDRCEVGTNHWVQCNDTPVKFARFPVTGLIEGRSYIFRVRAVNNVGISRPSRVSEPVAALDPADKARLKGIPLAPWTGQIIVTEEEPAEGVVPGQPTELAVTEATRNYVVLSWKPPGQRGHEGIMYYVEKCVAGTEDWQRVNPEIPVKSPRFALFDLAEGKSYRFRVRSANSAGISEPSEPTEFTEVTDKLDVPKAPSHVVPSRNTDTSMVVTWEESKDAKELVGYYIEASISGSGKWEPCNNKPVKGKRFICHGLQTGQLYKFRVRAVNAAGLSQFSHESEALEVKAALGGGVPHAAPPPPYGITVLESVRDSMVLGWKQPKFQGGADITGYFVDYREIIDGIPGKWKEANIKAITERAYRIHDLKENMVYQFQVRAINMAGVGLPSLPSEKFTCEEWTIAVPGPPHDVVYTEVRKNSLVLLWKAPIYSGRSEVTGYYADIREADADDEKWRSVNEKEISKRYIKVQGLKEGVKYVFRVRAVNRAGVGKPSDLTEPVTAETPPGTKEIAVNVDDDGVISLTFECADMAEGSKFIWSKNYEDLIDSSRVTMETKGGKTKIIFNDPGKDDLGIYSCVVTETDGVSSSYAIDEAELLRLLELSHEHKFPVVPLKSELAVELLEKGQVRFWLEAERLSPNGQCKFVFNDKEIKNDEKYKIKVDHKTGLVEMIMDKLEDINEGTYTVQLQDGKASNQSSLVLIGDVFKNLQKEAEFQRGEWLRKQGPHFVEYLKWEVNNDCSVLLKCKVANIKKETSIIWYKDDREIMFDEKHDFKDGVCTLLVQQFSKKDAGVYEIVLKDDRGRDSSTLRLLEKAFGDVISEVCRAAAQTATDLKVQSTEHGIRIYSFVTYYLDDLKIIWYHKDTKLASTDRVKSGVTGEQLWLQINEPTEKDKGQYTLELFDGKAGHKKSVELSGTVFDEAFAEFQRLKQAAIAEKNRARVIGGLPDVVTIQEGKSLNLTCNVWGEPVPTVSWLKNDRELLGDAHLILKFDSGKFASFTITDVRTTDSGKYSILVKNKYGTETGDFTLMISKSCGELCVAMYVADAAGNVQETLTKDTSKTTGRKTVIHTGGDLKKPIVEELIATEETPDQTLIPESPEDIVTNATTNKETVHAVNISEKNELPLQSCTEVQEISDSDTFQNPND
ncbi:M-protein, striated muscle isoform X5 [Chiloscyllium plagiosum]|uniref:M-protein, striated muscle isoform X5 n=1 Tax=Chiloscyllium plagiosum TaxID=36176 RepID=UPI001CB7B141|nr:M-protein, striated muscle isoform X5 [Chiloscyllium plagiosum]